MLLFCNRIACPPWGRLIDNTVILRGLPANGASLGGVLIRCRCAISCGWRPGRRFPITRGCRRRAGGFPNEVHEKVFGWVLQHVAEQGLVQGKRVGVDASTMEANAALRTIVRRDDGQTYREMLTQMAKESGIDTPTADDLVRIDRNCKGKRLSNEEWTSKTHPETKLAKM